MIRCLNSKTSSCNCRSNFDGKPSVSHEAGSNTEIRT